MRNSIPNITEAKVITAFNRGLHHHDLCSKFNHKPPKGIGKMIMTADQYADAEEAKVHSMRMRALTAQLAAATSASTNDTIVTATTMTTATIRIVVMIG